MLQALLNMSWLSNPTNHAHTSPPPQTLSPQDILMSTDMQLSLKDFIAKQTFFRYMFSDLHKTKHNGLHGMPSKP
jgi:hypothetical protein